MKTRIKPVATKRQAQLRAYDRVKAELEQELKASGKWICFFSGLPLPEEAGWKDISWHHCMGRDDELVADKEFVRPVLDHYHTGDEGYHPKPISYLKTLWWWNGYLERLKEMSYDLWYHEITKMER